MIVSTRSQRWLFMISLCCLLLGIGSAYLGKRIGLYANIALSGLLILPLLYRFYHDSKQKPERLFYLFSFGAITGVILFSCFMMLGGTQYWFGKQNGAIVHTSASSDLAPRVDELVPRTDELVPRTDELVPRKAEEFSEIPPVFVKESVITQVPNSEEVQRKVVKPNKNTAKKPVKKAKGEHHVHTEKQVQRQTFSPPKSVRPVPTPDFILKSEYPEQK